MTTDRRKPQGRRGSVAGEGDRRNRNDRRDADRRGKTMKDRDEKIARPAKSSGFSGIKGFFKIVAILFMASLAVFSLVFIVFFANLDYFMGKAGERILIGAERVIVDPSSLTDRSSRASINFRVNNRLPLSVVLQNITFSMHLGGYPVATDASFMPRTLIKGNSAATVPVWCQADSIMTRRGLQKIIENKLHQPAPAVISVRSSTVANDLRKASVLEGTAEFRISAGGIEIPLRRHFSIGKP